MAVEPSELDTIISEGLSALKAVIPRSVVVRSFGWAAIFTGIGFLLHPTIVSRFLHQSNYLGVFVVIALLFGLSMAKLTEQMHARTEKPSIIRATGIILTNSEGMPVGYFGQRDGDAFILLGIGGRSISLSRQGLQVFDGGGNPRAALEMTDDGPRLALEDDSGEELAVLEVIDDGPVLSLKDVTKREVVQVNTFVGGSLDILDTEGNACVSMSAAIAGGGPGIEITDSTGKVVWKAPTPA